MAVNIPVCRFCGNDLRFTFCDLGMSPLSNSFLTADRLSRVEKFYPLHALLCEKCMLVQLEQFEAPESIFTDYLYFSSYSETWLEHAREFCRGIIQKEKLTASSRVVEIASNDGYLLQNFLAAGVPVLGVEPAENVAKVAISRGIETIVKFFGSEIAKEICQSHGEADLIVANNVLAHVPDLNDFVRGLSTLLSPAGLITLEFPHVMKLIESNQFDTIYHEHFSYFSLLTIERVFAAQNLYVEHVEELTTHGGSLRIYVRHKSDRFTASPAVEQIRNCEIDRGLNKVETYTEFEGAVRACKRSLLSFLLAAKNDGKSIVAYGAPAKGNTLLNYCGVRSDFIDYVVDRSPHKQGLFLPGTHLPVHSPELIRETKPDYLLILPWNISPEIVEQMDFIRSWGGKFLVPIPSVRIIE